MAKIQAKFYCPAEIWAAAQKVMDEQGHKYSEGMTRLLAKLVTMSEPEQEEMFRMSPSKVLASLATPSHPASTGSGGNNIEPIDLRQTAKINTPTMDVAEARRKKKNG